MKKPNAKKLVRGAKKPAEAAAPAAAAVSRDKMIAEARKRLTNLETMRAANPEAKQTFELYISETKALIASLQAKP
jgi:hypothetical protein